ncbi:MAG: hypothetical protein PHT12_02650 [Patescibacteria group bacterium]|nr:hypothetical protein [Patescibacteria group bacterium]
MEEKNIPPVVGKALAGLKPHLKRKYVPWLAAAVVVAVAYATGYAVGSTHPTDGGFAAGYASAQKKIADSRIFPENVAIHRLAGKVVTVGTDSLVIEANQTVRNPLDEQAPTQRTIKVGPDTKLYRAEALTSAELAKAAEEFNAAQRQYAADLAAGKTPVRPTPPSRTRQTEIKLSDLRAGQTLTVMVAKEDILRAASFTADEIDVTLSPAPAGNGAKVPAPTEPAE